VFIAAMPSCQGGDAVEREARDELTALDVTQSK